MLSKPLLIALAVLLATNVATGWIAQHAIKAQGEAEAAAAVADARAEQYRAGQAKAEQAALIAQRTARKADAARAQAYQRLSNLERTQPDVKAWSDAPVPAAALECLRDDNCG